ncbi:hypothetical protein [Streptomyces sp. TP-A0356]|uniref:hypothetical protein n=1 Tax=Streptomyces sp. TP-A0356 TaxID=1359208 RepID=UPI0006E30DEC|nr:hypothetical protein [Streptomyces sp. TP-A0356]
MVVGLAASLAGFPSIAHAATFHISCGDTGGLRNAITALNNPTGGTIELEERCTYTFTDSVDGNNALPQVTGKITIVGDDTTIARGSSGGNTEDLFRLFEVDGSGDLTLRGVTVSGGHVKADTNTGDGGGIKTERRLTLVNSAVTGNTIDGATDGGGIQIEGGTTTLRDSTIANNTAPDVGADGGGISVNSNGALTLKHTKVTGNSSREDGGGVISQGTVKIEDDSVISHNSAGDDGGGIQNNKGTLRIEDSVLSDNTVASAICTQPPCVAGDGGAINNGEGGSLDSDRTTVSENVAARRGGGINNEGQAKAKKTEIKANSAGGDGGGIYNENAPEESPTTFELDHSTVTRNRAAGNGGGIFNQTGAVIRLNETTVKRNKPNNCFPSACAD